jgi:hypothetical protein
MDIYQVKNFIDQKDINKIINYMDSEMGLDPNLAPRSRRVLKFGGQEDSEYLLPTRDIEILGDIKDLIISLWIKGANTIMNETKTEKIVYPSTLWLSKQWPGNFIAPHRDNNELSGYRYSHSAILYLNKQSSGGKISFPEQKISIAPETGEFVFFDALELHEVTMVRQNRYTVTMWFTEDPQYKHEVI